MNELPRFRFVHVFRPQAGVLAVRWSIEPTAFPLEDIVFEVFRSNSPTGPWDFMGAAQQGAYNFTDWTAIGDPASRNFYFIVRAASISGKGWVDSDPVLLEHDADNIALELVRKKMVYLTVKGGLAVAVFIKKSWGAKCSRCWNAERLLANDAFCPECYGTGFAGGYMNPVFVPAILNPPRKVIVDAGLKYEPFNIYLEIANHPVLNPGDLIVDRKQNLRFNTEQISVMTRRMHHVSQICTLNRVDENSILYSLKVPEPPHAPENRSWDLVDRPGMPRSFESSVAVQEDAGTIRKDKVE